MTRRPSGETDDIEQLAQDRRELRTALLACLSWMDWMDDPRCGLGDGHKQHIKLARDTLKRTKRAFDAE